MLNSAVSISQRNIATTKRLMNETDIIFVPATGKSRSGAVRAMAALGDYLKEKYPAGCPGVFLQGLIVFGTDGNVVYENKCDPELASVVVDIARELDLSLIAYSRDTILCEKMDEFVELLPSCHVRLHHGICFLHFCPAQCLTNLCYQSFLATAGTSSRGSEELGTSCRSSSVE